MDPTQRPQGQDSGIMSSILNFFGSPASKSTSAAQPTPNFVEQSWKRPQPGGAHGQPVRSPANVIGNTEMFKIPDAPKQDAPRSSSANSLPSSVSAAPSPVKAALNTNIGAQNMSADDSSSAPPADATRQFEDPKMKKFRRLLERENGPDLESLKQFSWSGIPSEFRPLVWRMLMGYCPLPPDRREATLEKKRTEYQDMLARHYVDIANAEVSPEWLNSATPQEKGLLHQIRIDVPRTLPHNKMFREDIVQKALERILFVWALRHPASSYVQGINDLVTPFYNVFIKEQIQLVLQERAGQPTDVAGTIKLIDLNLDLASSSSESLSESRELSPTPEMKQAMGLSSSGIPEEEVLPLYNRRRTEDEDVDLSLLSEKALFIAEADAYWCVSKFIDVIQDNYTFAQPGIQRMVIRLKELVARLDAPLFDHLDHEGAQFIQFSFRWMNCLLMREFPLNVIVRLWDTYLAESEQFPVLHTYVCAAMLLKYSRDILARDFQGLMIFLQNLPTQHFQPDDIEPILSQAFMWKSLYNDAPSHLK